MAGVEGFEPSHDGTRTRCLTTWLHPKADESRIKDLELRKEPQGLIPYLLLTNYMEIVCFWQVLNV